MISRYKEINTAEIQLLPASKRKSDVSRAVTSTSTSNPTKWQQNKTSRSSRKREYPLDCLIYDAEYEEITSELEPTKKREFKTVPPRDARNLGVSKRSKSLEKRKPTEPAAITAISDQKRRTKSEILNFNPTRPSKAHKSPNDDWLIDKMYDGVVKVAKGAGKVGKVAVREGFQVTKTGICAIGELGEEFERTPMAHRWRENAEAEYSHMKSAGRRARDSIAGAGNVVNKRRVTVGALINQKGAKTAMSDGSIATNPQGITAHYERWMDGRTEVYFYYKGRRMTHQQVGRILTPKQISRLKQEAKNGITRKTHAGVV